MPYAVIVTRALGIGLAKLNVYEPADQFFGETLCTFSRDTQISVSVIPNPGFITNREDWMSFRKRTRLRMANFYKIQRQKTRSLMEKDGEPTGHKWSFDKENRTREEDLR